MVDRIPTPFGQRTITSVVFVNAARAWRAGLLLATAALIIALSGLAVRSPTRAGMLGDGFLSGFTDDSGRRVERRHLQRSMRIVLFGYTTCPDVCPLTLLALHQALVTLGSQANLIDPVFITVDPGRDTIARLHNYVQAFDARIRAYRGEPHRLERLAEELDVQYSREPTGAGAEDYGMNHTDTLFFIARDGRVLARVHHYTNPTILGEAIVSAYRGVPETPTASGERG